MTLDQLVSYFEIAAYVIAILIGIDYIYKEYCVKNVEDILDERINKVLTRRLSTRIKEGVNEAIDSVPDPLSPIDENREENSPLLQDDDPLKTSASSMSIISLMSIGSRGEISPTIQNPSIQKK